MLSIGKDKDTDFGLCRMDQDQVKKARLNSTVDLGMGGVDC